MSDHEIQDNTLHERTILAMRLLQQQALMHVDGLDRVILSQAIPMVYPRLERRIANTPESELQQYLMELKHMLEDVLQEPKPTPPAKRSPRRKTKRRVRRAAQR